MANVGEADLRRALERRQSHIAANLDVLSMKACRKMLEEDLGLPEKSLALHKEVIQRFVDKIVAEQSDQQIQHDETRVASKKRKTDRASEHVKENTMKRSKPELITAAAPARTSRVVDQAKRICKQASIKIPPSTYAKTKSLTEVEAEFESLLNKHGLSLDATSHFIEKVRRKLEKERELEGLDVSNIVVGDRRARHAAAPINYAALEAANSSDDDSSDEEQRHSDSPNNDPASDADEVSGSQGAASDAETSDHDAESSDADMADPVQDSMSSPRPGHKPARSRNTAIQDSDDE